MMEAHVSFLEAAGRLKVADMMGALRGYAHVDPAVAYHLWVLVFPIVWATLEKQQQINLAKPIIQLLSKEYHQRQAGQRPNVIQALLEGISLSQPQPKIPPELIKFLGKTYNAWHIATPLLESHVLIFPDETRCFDALVEVYKHVNEEDMMLGLWRKRCASDYTRVALSQVQHGMWDRAQELLGEAQRQAANNGLQVSRGERAVWVDQWCRCARQLSQWDVLVEYARGTDSLPLTLDCAWRLSDWGGLQSLLQAGSVGSQIEETPQVLMVHAYSSLFHHKVAEAEAAIGTAMQQALQRWWQLPDVGAAPHVLLLQAFQQLVELRESARVLLDLQNSSNGAAPEQGYADLKDILETWRLRTPNEWEPLGHWQDVLMWRNTIYNIVINAFRGYAEIAPQLHQLGYRDKAWSVNRLGYVAYKHGCPDVCNAIINNMYGYNAMEVQEAFVKIKEQAESYLDMAGEATAGLNLLNTTNLDYFQPHHQAELFRLKGLFLQKLEDNENANMAFSTALMLYRQSPEAWTSWAVYCDSMFDRARDQAAGGGAAAAGSQAQQWLEQAACCYLQGIRLGSQAARDLLPRLLYLLAFENDTGVVGRQLDGCVYSPGEGKGGGGGGCEIPLWVWLTWIPQLLIGLQRAELPHVKKILTALALHHPQALYYNLRTTVLISRESSQKQALEQKQREAAEAAARQAAGGAADAKPEATAADEAAKKVPTPDSLAFDAGKEIHDALRTKHPQACQMLEVMLSDIGSKFVPKPEERLLAVVNALLHRCYKVSVAAGADVPQALQRELAGVCKACFSQDVTGRPSRSAVQREVREAFVADLNPEGDSFPRTLGELSERLKAWRNKLQSDLEDKMPGVLRLEEECRGLQELALGELEMPGQHLSGHQVPPDATVYLEYISANIQVIRRHSSSYRRLAFHGSDGRVRHMLVSTGMNWTQGLAEERLMQLLRLMNRLLDKHPDSRRRLLAWHTPVMIPVWQQVRIVEEEPSYCTYGEAYEVNCSRYGKEADAPILHLKKRLAGPDGAFQQDPQANLRLLAFGEVCERMISDNVFSQYMYKTLPTCNHLWVFKKQFCTQMALSALLSRILLIGGRSPNKILFAKDTGRVFQQDYYILGYGERGWPEQQESVPFRLTRNLSTFFTTFGVEGIFITAMVAAAGALLQKHSNLQHVLALFFRDDIFSYTSRRGVKASSAGGGGGGGVSHIRNDQLKSLVGLNVKKTMERVRGVAPRRPADGGGELAAVSAEAAELVEQAMNPRSLCRMDPTWHPWF